MKIRTTARALSWAAMALAMVLSGPQASAQAAPKPPVIELGNPNCANGIGCRPVLVNKDTTSRVVATLKITPTGVGLFDQRGQPAPLRERFVGVLLLPGEQKPLRDVISFDPGSTRVIRFANSIAGSYVPKPDLTDLPRPPATEQVRFYESVSQFPRQPNCPDKYAGKMWGMRMANLSPDHAVNVTYRQKVPGYSQEVQTAYLEPGLGEHPMACIVNWANDVEFIEIRYAD